MQDNNKMETLTERIDKLKEKGFNDDYKIKDCRLVSPGGETYSPNQIKIVEHYRFEGQSDPGDMTVVYAVETDKGEKAMITDGFGTYSDEATSEFLKKVTELHKGKIY